MCIQAYNLNKNAIFQDLSAQLPIFQLSPPPFFENYLHLPHAVYPRYLPFIEFLNERFETIFLCVLLY